MKKILDTNNTLEEYCIFYSFTTHYETPWFKAKSRKDAIKHVRMIVGSDVKIEHIKQPIGRPVRATKCNS